MLATSFSIFVPVAEAQISDPQVPVSQILLNKTTFNRNEPIIIDIGAIGFFPACPGGSTGEPGSIAEEALGPQGPRGIQDFIYPWADIYIVPGRAAIGPLTDVNGTPNAVAGLSGGGIFDELIGVAGSENLPPGVYSIVVDECQDGNFDFNDTAMQEAFRITTRTNVEPLRNIGVLKAGAGRLADVWKAQADAWEALINLEKALGFASNFVTNPPSMAIAISGAQFAAGFIPTPSMALPDPKVVVATQYAHLSLIHI